VDYFVAPAPSAGSLTWTYLILQIAIGGIGVYLAFFYGDRLAVRQTAVRRLGYAMLAIGLAGAVLGILRMTNVAPFTARFWSLLVLIFEIALGVFAYYYSRTTLPQQIAAAAAASRNVRRSAARPAAAQRSNLAQPPTERASAPLPEGDAPYSTRREARRERKRRKK
jgi:hypothetical protein